MMARRHQRNTPPRKYRTTLLHTMADGAWTTCASRLLHRKNVVFGFMIVIPLMLSRLAQQSAKRALPVRTVQFASFSTAELIPGYGKGKTSTGIVGIPYDPNGVANVIVYYQALLDRIAASDLPAKSQYRVDVETIANYRIKIAKENPDDPDLVEDLCQCGQVEELIEQAKDEMEVLDMYLKDRLWEHIADVEVDVEYNPDPSADHEGVEEPK